MKMAELFPLKVYLFTSNRDKFDVTGMKIYRIIFHRASVSYLMRLLSNNEES